MGDCSNPAFPLPAVISPESTVKVGLERSPICRWGDSGKKNLRVIGWTLTIPHLPMGDSVEIFFQPRYVNSNDAAGLPLRCEMPQINLLAVNVPSRIG